MTSSRGPAHGRPIEPIVVTSVAPTGGAVTHRRLARPVELERTCVPDREAMLAALRVTLGLPRILPGRDEDAA